MIGISEIDPGLEFAGYGFMFGELPAVIGSNGINPASIRSQLPDHLLLDGLSRFMVHLAQQRKLAYCDGYQGV